MKTLKMKKYVGMACQKDKQDRVEVNEQRPIPTPISHYS